MSMIVNSIKMFYNKYQFGFFINHELQSNNNEYMDWGIKEWATHTLIQLNY
jgi:hypothetical protein